MELIERVKSIFGADLEKYLNELNLGPKDRVIVLLGETGHGKSTFINKITNSTQCKVSPRANACTKIFKWLNYLKMALIFILLILLV